ncbi:MAG: sulfite exporter TauE/SafE family protein [Gammaproteobacteria bacterium]
MSIIIYLILGATVGLLSGLLGIGGGTIIVPGLIYIFTFLTPQIPAGAVPHMAIGTSLSTMVMTSMVSIYAHHRAGRVRWDIVKTWVFTLVLGVIAGGIITDFLSAEILKIAFAIFLIIVAIRMFLKAGARKDDIKGRPKNIAAKFLLLMGGLIGLASGMFGIGGGVLAVPFLTRYHISMPRAAATASAGTFPIALVGTITFIVTGWNDVHIPWSSGYVYWPAFLGIIAASVIFAPIGVRLTQVIPGSILKRILALILVLVAIDLIF